LTGKHEIRKYKREAGEHFAQRAEERGKRKRRGEATKLRGQVRSQVQLGNEGITKFYGVTFRERHAD